MTSFAATVSQLALEDDLLEPDQVVSGSPVVSHLVLNAVAGDVCVLTKGERTWWTIYETRRKVYQITETT